MLGLLPARFPEPLAEPDVRLSTHPALHGCCRQALTEAGQGLGILVARQRYRVTGIAAMRCNSVSPALIGRHLPVAVTKYRRTSFHCQRCRAISMRITRFQVKLSKSLFLNLSMLAAAFGEAPAGDADHGPADHGLMVGG